MAKKDKDAQDRFVAKTCGWIPVEGHSSLLSEAEFKLYDSKHHSFQVTFAGNFVINDIKQVQQEEKGSPDCMSSYDNDTGHFKAKKEYGPAVAKYWSFQGTPMWVNHEGAFELDDVGVFGADLPPVMHEVMGMPPPMDGMPPPMKKGFGHGKAQVGYDNDYSISSEYVNGYYEPDIGHDVYDYLINPERMHMNDHYGDYQYGYYSSLLVFAGIDILLAIILICLSLMCVSILAAIYIYKIKENKDRQICQTIPHDIESN